MLGSLWICRCPEVFGHFLLSLYRRVHRVMWQIHKKWLRSILLNESDGLTTLPVGEVFARRTILECFESVRGEVARRLSSMSPAEIFIKALMLRVVRGHVA